MIIMITSGKPRKQRLFRYTASNSERQKLAHAHVSKELAKKLGIRLRSTSVRKGDTVRIMSGKSKGKSGKIIGVNLKSTTIFVENVVRKDAKGKEKHIPISASSVYITDFDLSDKLRAGKLRVQRQAAVQQPVAGVVDAPGEKK